MRTVSPVASSSWRALDEGLHAHRDEVVVGGLQLFARVDAAVLIAGIMANPETEPSS